MQMMAKIVGVTHIFIYQVRWFNYISILQKGEGVDSNAFPPALESRLLDPGPHSVTQEQ